MAEVIVFDFQAQVIKGIAVSALVFWIIPSRGSQLPCWEDTQAALGRGVCGEKVPI